jgi:hypothetical protein
MAEAGNSIGELILLTSPEFEMTGYEEGNIRIASSQRTRAGNVFSNCPPLRDQPLKNARLKTHSLIVE